MQFAIGERVRFDVRIVNHRIAGRGRIVGMWEDSYTRAYRIDAGEEHGLLWINQEWVAPCFPPEFSKN